MTYTIHTGDALRCLQDMATGSVHCCVTSPPYFGLRDYGVAGQMGLEPTPQEYVDGMVAVFREVRRVLRDDGTLWLNLGDSYAGSGKGAWGSDDAREANRHRVKETYVPTRAESPLAGNVPAGLKHKDLIGVPWRVAFALQADGWYLRQDIIWHKPNPMPESVTDRCTKSHEYVFLMSKSARYHYDAAAIAEAAVYGEQHAKKATSWGTNRKHPNKANAANYAFAGDNSTCHKSDDGEFVRNRRDVWTIPTKPCKLAHFAVMPTALATLCVKAGCPHGGTVLDPFAGAGTTILAALLHDRSAVGIELNQANVAMIHDRVHDAMGLLLMAHAEGVE